MTSPCGFDLHFANDWASLVAQKVKNLSPAMQETRV